MDRNNPEEVFTYWVSEFQKVYDNRTAGDFTFIGMLSNFYSDMRNAETVNNF